MKRIRSLLAGAAGLLAITAFAGTTRRRAPNASSSTSATSRRRSIRRCSGIRDSYYVYRNIFDNLVTRDDAGKIVPEVATAWKYISDTEIEFTLRPDITFHDGTKLTADDVAFSVKRITDPKFGSPQLGQFNKIVDATAIDPTTVRLKTDGPYPALLAQLVKLSIVPKQMSSRRSARTRSTSSRSAAAPMCL